MRFIVYGAGAVGSIIGGHLFRNERDVVLVANPKHVEAIQESGLRLVTPDETYLLKIPAYKGADELTPFRDDDVVLLTPKSQHVLRCLGQLKNSGAPRNIPLLCCQNGISTEPLATRIFDSVYGVNISMAGIFLEPGEVFDCVVGGRLFIELGLYPRGADDLAHKIADIFKTSGFAGDVNTEIMKAKAAKCLVSLGHSLAAITDGEGNGESFISEVRREAEMVWRAAGIEYEDVSTFLERVRRVRGKIKRPRSFRIDEPISSWQSLERGTGNIEAEHLNGDVVKLGRPLDIDTPYNELVWRVADEMAKEGEKPGKYTVEELIQLVGAKGPIPR